MTLVEFMKTVESSIVPMAVENSEGSYEFAKERVRQWFKGLPLTDRQVTDIVNRVWDRVNVKEVI